MAQTPEYAGVVHILTSPLIAARTEPYIQPDDFDWTGLLAEAGTMSGGERVLVGIAHDLWEAGGSVAVSTVPRALDPGNFERVIEALRIYRAAA